MKGKLFGRLAKTHLLASSSLPPTVNKRRTALLHWGILGIFSVALNVIYVWGMSTWDRRGKIKKKSQIFQMPEML